MVLLNNRLGSRIFYNTAEDCYEFAITYSSEEAFKVYYTNVAFSDYRLYSSQCVTTTSSRTEVVVCLGQVGLIDRNQYLLMACCTKLSTTMGIPQRHILSLPLDNSTRLTGIGRQELLIKER